MNIAIIPARGGSKRIPRKNIREFHGKPMIAYSIETARESGCFDSIVVSTEDDEIARIAREYGAEVPFVRPGNISDDHSTTMDVVQHAVIKLADLGWEVENVCCIYATAPFLEKKMIKKGFELLRSAQLDYTFSATTFPFPIQRALRITTNGLVSMFQPENEFVRSQDLEEAYHDAGQFYWGRKKAFEQGRAIFSSESKAVLLSRNRVQDIDTPEDWARAELLYSMLHQQL